MKLNLKKKKYAECTIYEYELCYKILINISYKFVYRRGV